MAQDYYSTLGVSKSASGDDIKKAYRRLAHQYHPDKDKGNEAKFKEVNEAYQVLSDQNKRQQYDQFGTTFQNGGFQGQGQGFEGFDFSNFAQGFGFNGQNVEFDDPFDIFSNIFGGGGKKTRREKGVDLEMDLNLSFEEAVSGVEKEISIQKNDACPKCNGSGAEPGSKVVTCPKCHGTGQIRVNRRTILGQMATVTTCDQCEGTGKIPEHACFECKGSGRKRRVKTLKVRIPAGIDDGQRIRVSNEGEAGYKGSNFGDLYLRLHVSPNSKFKREGENIYSDISISFYQAVLGTKVEIDTVDGKVELKIPSGTQSGKVFRLKSRGVPYLNDSGRGDHFVTCFVTVPTKLSKKEKDMFKKLADEKGEPIDEDEGFFGRFKS